MAGECILIIDDSKEIITHLAEHVLPLFDYTTLHAYDGKSGLQTIREKKPDLVMLDYNLPEMTGLDVLQQMAMESLTTPVVLMTGYGSELSAIEAFRLGAKDYLIKPFTVDEIVETIDRALTETRLLHDKKALAEQVRRIKVEMSRQTHEMNTLFSIGKAITSLLSVDKVLARVLEAATYLVRAEESVIWLPDESGKHLHVYERSGSHQVAKQLHKVPISESQLGQVMRNGRPLRQSVFSGQGIKMQTGLFARAVLSMPLKLRGVTVGVLSVSNIKALRSFSKRDEFLLSFLADYAAISLENARVFQAADQALAARLEELNTLIDITRVITASLNLDEVVRTTIKQVHDGWNIEASSIWLVNDDRLSLRVLTNVGTPGDILTQMQVPMGEGFVGTVAETGKWIYTNDVATHPLHYREIDSQTGFKTRSLLCVPLIYRAEVVGAMQLLNKLDGHFDDRDVERALSIAAAVAIAVTNAMLFAEAESQKQHLEGTLEHTNNPIIITDAQNRVLLLNQEARRRLNLTKGVIGEEVTAVMPVPTLSRLFTQPIDIKSVEDLEITLADESIWLPRLGAIPGHGHILILQEITAWRALDDAKDHFVATVSHDLRAPLNNIHGFAQNLAAAGSLTENQKIAHDGIMRATNHMLDMVDSLLELAKINAKLAQFGQICHLDQITTAVVEDFQARAMTTGIELSLHVASDVATVDGDPGSLHRVVSNLLDNAIKYSPPGQPIDIDIRNENDSVRLYIRDRGPGIDAVDLPHIFDKFYRGRAVQEKIGTGLGLALAYSIVEAHGGKIWAENESTGGACFIILLPQSG